MKTAIRYMFEPLRKYASFSGRARRLEIWMFMLFYVAMSFVLAMIYPPLSFGFGLLIFLPAIAVFARRMHDIGYSGWWVLPIATLSNFTDYLLGRFYFLDLLLLVANAAIFIVACIPGNKGENRFGENPLLEKLPSFREIIQGISDVIAGLFILPVGIGMFLLYPFTFAWLTYQDIQNNHTFWQWFGLVLWNGVITIFAPIYWINWAVINWVFEG